MLECGTGLASCVLDPHRLVGHEPGAGAPHAELIVEPCRVGEMPFRVLERPRILTAAGVEMAAGRAPEHREGACPSEPLVPLGSIEDQARGGLGAGVVALPDQVAGTLDLDRAD